MCTIYMVANEVVETPYAVCKTAVLTVELIGNNHDTFHMYPIYDLELVD